MHNYRKPLPEMVSALKTEALLTHEQKTKGEVDLPSIHDIHLMCKSYKAWTVVPWRRQPESKRTRLVSLIQLQSGVIVVLSIQMRLVLLNALQPRIVLVQIGAFVYLLDPSVSFTVTHDFIGYRVVYWVFYYVLRVVFVKVWVEAVLDVVKVIFNRRVPIREHFRWVFYCPVYSVVAKLAWVFQREKAD